MNLSNWPQGDDRSHGNWTRKYLRVSNTHEPRWLYAERAPSKFKQLMLGTLCASAFMLALWVL